MHHAKSIVKSNIHVDLVICFQFLPRNKMPLQLVRLRDIRVLAHNPLFKLTTQWHERTGWLNVSITTRRHPFNLSPCAVESHPTPGESRGSSSPSRSISGVSSHVADGGSARIPLECVQPSLSRSSSLSRSIHSPEHHVFFHPSCSHHLLKLA